MTYNKIEYNNKYNKENYERFTFRVKKGEKERIEEHLKNKGYTSFNSYLSDLIKADMEISNQKINVNNNHGIIMGDNNGTIHM